jgi:CDGSH-type Zn-finger protein/truncated hemoglobin YjbI
VTDSTTLPTGGGFDGVLEHNSAAAYAGVLAAGLAAARLPAGPGKRAQLDEAVRRLQQLAQLVNIAVALGAPCAEGLDPVTAAAVTPPTAESGALDGLDEVAAALGGRDGGPWPTAGQIDGAVFGVDTPVLVDGPQALHRALELLAEPYRVPVEAGDDQAMPDDSPEGVSDLVTEALLVAVVLAGRAVSDPATGAASIGVVLRLLGGVLRPLAVLVAGPPPAVTFDALSRHAQRPTSDLLVELANRATELVARGGRAAEAQSPLLEATAALQDVALASAGSAEAPQRWWDAIDTGRPVLRSSRNGPYLGVGVRGIVTHLGEPVPTRPVVALCRCGRSATKPLCDGTHARVDFTGQKDPHRVPDQRDRHPGLQVTVLDNRGICQHSGFCTDRLPVVFRQGQEPFVAASGGRMDEIIRAVRDCPSGALSFEIDGREAREQVDGRREPGIEVSKDGPYRVTGGIELQDADGRDEHRNEGASREHYALCRCGQSMNKPFCSGMHWYVNFADPVPDPDEEPTLFHWVGGLPALRRLTRLFYEKHIPADPLLAPIFAEMSTDHPERVAKWLGEVFGGPKYFTNEYGGYPRMISQHLGKALSEAQRSRWASLMVQAANDAELPADAEFRAAFVSYIEWGSRIAVENSQPGAQPPPNMPAPQWWWACNATPRARVSALAPPPAEEPVTLPGPDEAVSFATHIKPMFRATDRNSMKFAFDLWALEDVTTQAGAILARLEAGTMPCDGAWPAERVEAFRRWVEGGKAP